MLIAGAELGRYRAGDQLLLERGSDFDDAAHLAHIHLSFEIVFSQQNLGQVVRHRSEARHSQSLATQIVDSVDLRMNEEPVVGFIDDAADGDNGSAPERGGNRGVTGAESDG